MALSKLHAPGKITEEFWQRKQAERRAEEAARKPPPDNASPMELGILFEEGRYLSCDASWDADVTVFVTSRSSL